MSIFDMIAFDADDTLWHTERFYTEAQAQLAQLLAQYHDAEWVQERLYQTEMRNVEHFGYGIKAFTLSMLETSIELTEGRICGPDIARIIELGKQMLSAEVELLEQVAETVKAVAARYPLMMITKGDLLDQERKIARSGLEPYFGRIEVVSDKTRESYARVLQKHALDPRRFLMVGNSLRSDILPVLELGAQAVYIPYRITWRHEQAEPPPADQPGFYELAEISQLPALLERLERVG